jgi:hypothetical protein
MRNLISQPVRDGSDYRPSHDLAHGVLRELRFGMTGEDCSRTSGRELRSQGTAEIPASGGLVPKARKGEEGKRLRGRRTIFG